MALQNTCERHVGRLLEIRIEAGYRHIDDVTAILEKVMEHSDLMPTQGRLVIVTDWRKCSVMAEEATEYLASGLRHTNTRIDRSAALLPTHSSVAMLQFVRVGSQSARAR